MIVTWVSEKGGRAVNEDAVGKLRKKGILCTVVADGLGGTSYGELASKLAVDSVLDAFSADPGFSKEHIERYISSANTAIVSMAKSDPNLLHMSSTIALVLKKGRYVMWATVGDTRVYKFSDGMISDVSEDDSLAFLDFANGDIEYDDIRTSTNQNKLTNALGIAMGTINVSDKKSFSPSDCMLICTDGWWVNVPDGKMEQSLGEATTAEGWLGVMLDIHKSNASADCDNYTAAIITG